MTAGIVLSDHSLVLQSITRESAGRYSCTAVNVEGRASSNVVDLEVMCEYIIVVLGKKKKNEKEKKKEERSFIFYIGSKVLNLKTLCVSRAKKKQSLLFASTC